MNYPLLSTNNTFSEIYCYSITSTQENSDFLAFDSNYLNLLFESTNINFAQLETEEDVLNYLENDMICMKQPEFNENQ